MNYIKNVRLVPAEGGYIVSCDKHQKSPDSYDGMRYVGEHKIVVEDGAEAIKIVDELFEASVEGGEIELPEPSQEENKSTNLMTHE